LPCAAGRSKALQGFSKKIDVQLLAAHQPFELGDTHARLGERRALVVIRLYRLELAETWFRPALAVQPLRPMGLPRLNPVMKGVCAISRACGPQAERLRPLQHA
jgi:hypothetical protein